MRLRACDPDYPDTDLMLAQISRLLDELGTVEEPNPSLALLEEAIEEASKNSRLGKAAREGGVRATDEFKRIRDLPRRIWTDTEAEKLTNEMTVALRQPEGTMKLRPAQAIALLEIGLFKGLLGPLRAGSGKTLTTFLAPTVLESKRPLLVLPAKLIQKTKRELLEYLKHFRCAYHLHLVSYESLSRVSHATFLDSLKPDLIILDEAHKAKNTKAGVTRRLKRYIEQSKPAVVALSGTVTKRSLHDYGHLSRWALGFKSPLPLKYQELEDWANAVDERPRATFRTPPGALLEFTDGHDVEAIREGLSRRIVESPGVVATNDKLTDCSLVISRSEVTVPPAVEDAFRGLRTGWVTPDGWELFDAMQVAGKARQIGLGLNYYLDPRPPRDWAEARSCWGRFVRETLKRNRSGLDTELQVAQACAAGKLPSEEYRAWKNIKAVYRPEDHRKTQWLDSFALDYCGEWLREHGKGALVWCDLVDFAKELSRRSGVSYFGAGGLNDRGVAIEEHPPGDPAILSIQSSSEGRNLQAWSQNLIVSPPSSGLAWEQALARTHRDGQTSDEVTVDVLVTCAEHESAFLQALNDAEYRSSTTQQPDRLTYCDLDWSTLLTRKPAMSNVDSNLFAWNK